MKNKMFKLGVFVLLFVALIKNDIYAADFHTEKLSSGIIGISHSEPGAKLKVVVQKGSTKYTYSLRNDGGIDYYPLQLGSGEYKVSALKNISGNKYSVLKSETVSTSVGNSNSVYLHPIQIVNYTNSDPAIQKAKSLGNVDKVYDYTVKNLKYDYSKAKTVQPGYYPIINDTFSTNKGICYDYSSMDAAMLRSIGIPAKLVKGYAKGVDGYHAWNEVFIDGQWYVIDTTYDAAKWGGKATTVMKKKTSDYQKVYEY